MHRALICFNFPVCNLPFSERSLNFDCYITPYPLIVTLLEGAWFYWHSITLLEGRWFYIYVQGCHSSLFPRRTHGIGHPTWGIYYCPQPVTSCTRNKYPFFLCLHDTLTRLRIWFFCFLGPWTFLRGIDPRLEEYLFLFLDISPPVFMTSRLFQTSNRW